MLSGLPESARDALNWEWTKFEPFYREIESRELSGQNVHDWLKDWTRLDDLMSEVYARLYINTTLDTTNKDYKAAFTTFLEHVFNPSQEADQRLKEKFLASGLEPEGFELPLKKMRATADLFREENLPLTTEHEKLGLVYYEIVGNMTVNWEGEEVTLAGLVPLVKDANRETRERAWRLASDRVLQERERINENWQGLIDLRRQIAKNAGKKDFREYTWQSKLRFDYTPEDAVTFHRAIEQAVVPATARVYERRRQRAGVDTLRPWDVGVDVMRNSDFTGDPQNRPPIMPFGDAKELEAKSQDIFNKVDPKLGEYYADMRQGGTLDLANYKGKGPGAYCYGLRVEGRPFVFLNAVGSSHDVSTMLHECGHAFHFYERQSLPYHQQQQYPMEFAEVASMAMELLGSPYLRKADGGFYTDEEYARAMVEHLEGLLVFWPYMAVVDSFNHWANTTEEGRDPAASDRMWGDLWDRYIVGPDWSGLHEEKVTGWHRKLHIHRLPFYYVEYGLAQLGAVQIWRNALKDQAKAVEDYRGALALGGSVSIPELFRAANVKFAFDEGTLQEAVDLIEETIDRLEGETALA